jgi:hypothetical protein
MVEHSKACICGHSVAGVAGFNPTEVGEVCLL